MVVYSPYVHTADCQGKDQNWAHFYFNSVPFALYVQTKQKCFRAKHRMRVHICDWHLVYGGVTTDAFLRNLKEVLQSEITEILNSGNSEIMVLLPCWKMPKKLKKKKKMEERRKSWVTWRALLGAQDCHSKPCKRGGFQPWRFPLPWFWRWAVWSQSVGNIGLLVAPTESISSPFSWLLVQPAILVDTSPQSLLPALPGLSSSLLSLIIC